MKKKNSEKKPDRKELGRYDRWVKYLTNTSLSPEQVHDRATQLTKAGRDP